MRVGRRRFLRATAVAGLILAQADVLAQPQGKVYRIGHPNLRAAPGAFEEAFLRGMRDRGYVVGRNLVIEYRWADNDVGRFQAMVEELVRLNVDVILTASGYGIRRAMRVTSTIPIVMAAGNAPYGKATTDLMFAATQAAG